MEEQLKFIFNNTNEFLKFAEAKNGAFIALNGAIIFTLFNIIRDDDIVLSDKIIPAISLLLFILSILLLFISFIPTFKKRSSTGKEDKYNKSDNCIFFGDISKLDPTKDIAKFRNILEQKVDCHDDSENSYQKDMINQIINNSKIAIKKFNLFTIAIKIDIASFILLFIAIIAHLT